MTRPARVLLDIVARNPRAPAGARVRALAAAEARFSTLTKSPPEDDMLALIRAGGPEEPEINVWVGPHEVDFLWPSERLIVFTDGYAFHSTHRSFEADHAQDLDLEDRGFHPMRFTRDQVTKQREWVLVRLAQRLAQLRRSSRAVD